MFTHSFWLLLFFIVGITGETPVATTLPPRFDQTAEERAVYEMLLAQNSDEPIVIRDTTSSILSPDMVLDTPVNYLTQLQSSLPSLESETWYHLLGVGDERAPFPTDLTIVGDYHLLSDSEFQDYFGTTDSSAWTRFEAAYDSNAFSTYSRIGFNNAGTQALLYRAVVCAGLCGEGGYVLLEKVGGVWQVVGEYHVWMS